MTEEKKESPAEEKSAAKEKKEEKKETPAKKKEEKKEAAAEVPEKFKKLVQQIEQLSVLELAELVKVLEEKFGVSPMAMAAAPAAGGAVPAGPAGGSEKAIVDIELKSAGGQKINVIKIVKEISGQGLKEAKDMVDGAPKIIKQGVAKEEAAELKKRLEEAGATVELK